MTIPSIILVNAVLSVLVIVAVARLTRLAHRLPSVAPHADESWGMAGDPWVVSDPLPVAQLARHEQVRALARAA